MEPREPVKENMGSGTGMGKLMPTCTQTHTQTHTHKHTHKHTAGHTHKHTHTANTHNTGTTRINQVLPTPITATRDASPHGCVRHPHGGLPHDGRTCPTSTSRWNLRAAAPEEVKIAVPLPYGFLLISSMASSKVATDVHDSTCRERREAQRYHNRTSVKHSSVACRGRVTVVRPSPACTRYVRGRRSPRRSPGCQG